MDVRSCFQYQRARNIVAEILCTVLLLKTIISMHDMEEAEKRLGYKPDAGIFPSWTISGEMEHLKPLNTHDQRLLKQ